VEHWNERRKKITIKRSRCRRSCCHTRGTRPLHTHKRRLVQSGWEMWQRRFDKSKYSAPHLPGWNRRTSRTPLPPAGVSCSMQRVNNGSFVCPLPRSWVFVTRVCLCVCVCEQWTRFEIISKTHTPPSTREKKKKRHRRGNGHNTRTSEW